MVAGKVCIAALLFGLLPLAVRGDEVALSADCENDLTQLWSNYTNPAYLFEGCDASCMAECKETLEQAIYTTSIKSCPLQADITRCFKYYAPEWEHYVEECALFTMNDSDLPAGSASEAGESGSPPAEDADTEVDAEAEAEAAGRRLLAEAEAEAAASNGAGICFPAFKSTEEFETYLNGQYFSDVYSPPSNTAGIILSVFFWVGLASMGLYLRN